MPVEFILKRIPPSQEEIEAMKICMKSECSKLRNRSLSIIGGASLITGISFGAIWWGEIASGKGSIPIAVVCFATGIVIGAASVFYSGRLNNLMEEIRALEEE